MADDPRFVAFDVHKSYVLIAALDAQLQVVLKPRRVKMADLGSWATQWLRSSDRVVLEATINAWTIYDLLSPLVTEVQVAHPLLVKLSSARVKTDTRDTLHLARLTFCQPHSAGVGPPSGGARVARLGGPSRAPGWATNPGNQSLAQRSAESQPRPSRNRGRLGHAPVDPAGSAARAARSSGGSVAHDADPFSRRGADQVECP
jgi:hypothetical protein